MSLQEKDAYSTKFAMKLTEAIFGATELSMQDTLDVIAVIRERLEKKLLLIEDWKDIKYTEGYFKKQMLNELIGEL